MKNILYIIIISIILSILFNLIYIKYNNILYNKNNNIDTVEIVKVDTFTRIDTVTKWYPKLVEVKVRDTIYIPIDSIKTEGNSILLPRETKTYEDSTYRAVVSGYKPSLDTLMVYPKTTYIVTEKVREIEKKQRFNIGLQVGSGYGIFTKQPDVYVGIGFQYNLW